MSKRKKGGAHDRAGAHERAAAPGRETAPASVVIALACLAASVTVRVADLRVYWDTGKTWAPLGLVALSAAFVAGLERGDRLAYRWARWLGAAGAAGLVAGAIASAKEFELARLVPMLLQAVALAGMVAALSTRSAAAHFRLVCPQCGRAQPQAEDPLFRRARCGACGKLY